MKEIGTAGNNRRKKRPTPPPGDMARVAEFWDTHDSTTYFAKEDLVPLRTWTKGGKVRHVYVAPDGSQYEMIPLRRRPRKIVPA
jgi:hypothetical protein